MWIESLALELMLAVIVLGWFVPVAALVYVAIVQALSKHWHTSLTAFLGVTTYLMLSAFALQGHLLGDATSRLRTQASQIEKLRAEIEELRKEQPYRAHWRIKDSRQTQTETTEQAAGAYGIPPAQP